MSTTCCVSRSVVLPLGGRRARCGFTLVELLVVIAIIGILIALLLPAVQAAREAARRAQCTNNLKQLALGQHNYADSYKTFTPGAIWMGTGNPTENGRDANWGATWTIMLLPYFEQRALHDQYDSRLRARTGDATTPNNMVARTDLSAMKCPSHPAITDRLKQDFDGFTKGNYAACAGAGRTMSAGDFGDAQRRGCFSVVRQNGASFADITDGSSNVVMLSEIVAVRSDSDDRGAWGWCAGAMFCGRATCGSSNRVFTPNTTQYMDCPPYSWNVTNVNTFNWRSDLDDSGAGGGVGARGFHPGGVNAAVADGSVRFLSETVDQTLYLNILAIADGNPVTMP